MYIISFTKFYWRFKKEKKGLQANKHGGLIFIQMAHYSETQLTQIYHWTESPFVRQLIILKTNSHFSKSSPVQILFVYIAKGIPCPTASDWLVVVTSVGWIGWLDIGMRTDIG